MKKNLCLRIYFICLFSTQISFAQISFEKTFGNVSDVERGFCAKQTYDGGYIVAGTNSGDETGSESIMLIKTDSMGNQMWNKGQFDFSLFQCNPNSIKITPDSGFIITGGSWSPGGNVGVKDVFLLKTDKSGNQQWVTTYDSITSNPAFGFYSESGRDVLITNDGGYLVTGHAVYEEFLLKTDSVGNIQWLAKDTGQCRAGGFSVTEAENNSYLVLGYTTPTLATNISKMYLTKFDAFGNKLWGQTYSWSQGNYSLGFSVKLNPNGEYVLLGEGRYNGSQYGEMLLIKTDTAGTPIWENSFLINNYTAGYALDVTNDNGYILTGESFDSIIGYRVYLVKTDSSGILFWDTTYSGDWGYSVQQTFDNGYVVAGVKSGDIYLLKTNSNGTLVSTTELVSPVISLNIYPNPTSGSIAIRLLTETDIHYDVIVYDANGKKISSIKNLSSNKKIVLNKKELHLGYNYIQFVSNSKTLCTRKILIF